MNNKKLRAVQKISSNSAFTLIELLVVIAILGILAGLIAPSIMDQPDKARVVKARMQMESIATALSQYKLDNSVYPSTQQGLAALVNKPNSNPVPRNYPTKPYMDEVPADPWGNAYIYQNPGNKRDFDIASLGADGMPGGEGVNADIKLYE